MNVLCVTQPEVIAEMVAITANTIWMWHRRWHKEGLDLFCVLSTALLAVASIAKFLSVPGASGILGFAAFVYWAQSRPALEVIGLRRMH